MKEIDINRESPRKALDANATCVDILLSTEKFTLQVNDNGYGVQNLTKVAQRHGEFKMNSISFFNKVSCN
jgi:DNA mismatch repair ATPase MutL